MKKNNLSRRNFIQVSAGTAAAIAFIPAIERGSLAGSRVSAFLKPDFNIEEASIRDLQNAMETGKLTSRTITEMYLKRIEELDKNGPALNSVIEINPDALEIADRLDKERKSKVTRGPLHGIPVLIKDNIDTADKMETTAGSLALVGQKPPEDAYVVKRLRDAGAVLLGKTNLSEWANFRSTRSSSGWSGRGGQTKNPFALNCSPCGSSSGSGVAVSANLCAVAVGTETDGSVVCPSSTNGVVGIKPTVGLVSRSGIIPISHSQDTAGPIARSVTDAAILLGAMTGIDKEDEITAESRGKMFTDYTKFLDADGLKNARIGVLRNFSGYHEKVDALMEEAIALMKSKGAELVDVDFPRKNEIDGPEFNVLLFEFKADLNSYLKKRGAVSPAANLEELIQFNIKNKEKEMPYFGQEIFDMAQAKGDLKTPEYIEALEKCRKLSRDEGIDFLLKTHKLDALIAPTGGPAWSIDLVNGDHFIGSSSTPAAVAGYPDITVPAGFISGLPVGISFFAGAYSEPVLLKLAYAYEQASKLRRVPEFSKSPAER